ncbi:hypothetical protein [Pontibacter fetidus]|uniref:Uncharacterized protein n=1 Tax=Pontibacter fetidus TaxID=2700082 RepID=A0A6B2H5A8_9BACT|nr:hypothetical protein [Pontibacter fetidus]NDK57661.1 hypothetical protein [Pontibacter fetidus]
MTSKDEYLLQTWPKQQAKGKTAYMATHSLIYAVLVGIITILFDLGDASVKDIILSKEFLVKLALFTTIGAIMANYKWKTNTKKYEALKEQHVGQPKL